jgi:GGDEF domain-containing protein
MSTWLNFGGDGRAAAARPCPTHARGAALRVPSQGDCPNLALADADDWLLLPATAEELSLRLSIAQRRSRGASEVRSSADAAELVRYEELLYDKLTGFPTLPVMIERARDLLERRGELTVLYIHFVWYEKIEEIYGWQKLDDVLETTAQAVRRFYSEEHTPGENIMMVSHIADDDFILFTEVRSSSPQAAELKLRDISRAAWSATCATPSRTCTARTLRHCAASTWARRRSSATRRSARSGCSIAASVRPPRRRAAPRSGSVRARSVT